ncbi:MAG: hypothetical protein ACOCZP_04175 [Candidatus Hadarchaeota archaeon]
MDLVLRVFSSASGISKIVYFWKLFCYSGVCLEFDGDVLRIGRELSGLDKLVLKFIQRLEDRGIEYVIVSGYVAVLTGRSRGTEDIDVILEEMERDKIEKFAEDLLASGYWCLNSEVSEIYDMLCEGLAPRFAEEGRAIPNFEINFPSDELEITALDERLKARINSEIIYISPLELQIAYKLYLGSEKDFEDALHLYRLFKEDLDARRLEDFAKELKVRGDLDELRKA